VLILFAAGKNKLHRAQHRLYIFIIFLYMYYVNAVFFPASSVAQSTTVAKWYHRHVFSANKNTCSLNRRTYKTNPINKFSRRARISVLLQQQHQLPH
jgi:hypothetical protein